MSDSQRDASGTEPYFLKTDRVAFRCWRSDDLPLAMALWGDPLVTKYLGGPFSPEQVQQRLDTEIVNMQVYGIQYWPFFLMADQEHAGCCGLRPRKPEQRIYELGVHLRSAFWARGLAEEAAGVVVRYAFETLGVRQLFTAHHPDNTASRRLLEKSGFFYSHDEFYPPTGKMHPGYIMKRPS
ncbi:MAG TPA: GNAT family N-acetyltransferase [Candidatus Angelobacter sp.]